MLIVCSVPKHVLKLLENSKLVTYLGKENIIPYDPRSVHGDLQKAVARARDLLHEYDEAVAYEIGSLPVIQQNFVTIPISVIDQEQGQI